MLHMKRMYVCIICLVFLMSAVGQVWATKPDAAIKAAAEKVMPAFAERLETLVNMDSGSHDIPELNAKKDYLVAELKKVGMDVTVLEVTEPAARKGSHNIVARLKGTGKAKIMLMGHYDTVWPKGEAAKRPFRIENGIAYGPGIADMQHSLAGILALVEMFQILKHNDFAVFTVLLNADEEIGSLGSRDLIMEEAGRHDVVFSMEGGGDDGDTIFISCRGNANAVLTVTGVAAHSGENPQDGRNAGVEMARQILNMLDLSDKEKFTDANWTLGSFGTRANVIPDTATATLNVRVSYMSENDRVKAEMEKRIQNVTDKDCEVTLDYRVVRPPFEPNDTTRLIATKADAIYKELGRTLQHLHMGGASDANFSYQRAPTIEGMGVGGGNWHALSESLTMKHVPDRLYLLMRLVQEIGKGNILPIGTPDR
jgi:glutamate carboxypeptidase